MHNIILGCFGILIGCINTILGTGGGLLAVPILRKEGLDQKAAQIHSIAIILPLSIISLIIYVKKEYVNFFEEIWTVPIAFLGALLGTYLFTKIPNKIFQKAFACFMIYGGVKMLLSL